MISVYHPNYIDFSIGRTVSFGQTTYIPPGVDNVITDFLPFERLRDRRNDTGITYTRADFNKDGTPDDIQLLFSINIGDSPEIDTIVLVDHNFKNLHVRVYDGINTLQETIAFNNVYSQGDRLTTFITLSRPIITRNQNSVNFVLEGDASVDPYVLSQVILTKKIGTFINQLKVSKIISDFDRKEQKMISKKSRIILDSPSVSYKLTKQAIVERPDLTLQEFIFSSTVPLLWSITQEYNNDFRRTGLLSGYAPRDIKLMMPKNRYNPEFNNSMWAQGAKIDIELVESV